ncbi:hypothetical protein O9X98_14855 [Agrobacterium salinitolerans]|nr:hypothetical protein [Agrobacterium salinitolerans]
MKDITDEELAEIERDALLTQKAMLTHLGLVTILGAVIMVVAYGFYLNARYNGQVPASCNPGGMVCGHPSSSQTEETKTQGS